MLRRRLRADELRIVTAAGATVAVHRAAPDGAGAVVRDQGHVRALEARVLQAFSDARPCRSKARRPAGEAARVEAARLRGAPPTPATTRSSTSSAQRVVVDMATYAALVPAAARATAPAGGERR